MTAHPITPCRLGDWLKLEDINNSLFLVTCDRKARAYKPPGARQPRYLKFFQVRTTYLGLLRNMECRRLRSRPARASHATPQVPPGACILV
jgi:hypothetical protein